jgi:hypothetical protein
MMQLLESFCHIITHAVHKTATMSRHIRVDIDLAPSSGRHMSVCSRVPAKLMLERPVADAAALLRANSTAVNLSADDESASAQRMPRTWPTLLFVTSLDARRLRMGGRRDLERRADLHVVRSPKLRREFGVPVGDKVDRRAETTVHRVVDHLCGEFGPGGGGQRHENDPSAERACCGKDRVDDLTVVRGGRWRDYEVDGGSRPGARRDGERVKEPERFRRHTLPTAACLAPRDVIVPIAVHVRHQKNRGAHDRVFAAPW